MIPSYAEESTECVRASFKTVSDTFGFTEEDDPEHPAFMKTEHMGELIETSLVFYGVFDGEKLIATGGLLTENERYVLHKLGVRPEYRCLGIGIELMDIICSEAEKLGAEKLWIDITEENVKVKNWYMSYGFNPEYTEKIEGLPYTVGYLSLNLKKKEGTEKCMKK